MQRTHSKRITSSATAIVIAILCGLPSSATFAADPPIDVEALQAQLEEAQKLLDSDKANHDKTAEKKRLIDEQLADRKQRESEIFDELKQLCEEQDKLQAGSLEGCMAKLNN